MRPEFFTFNVTDNSNTSYYMFFDNLRGDVGTPYLKVEDDYVFSSYLSNPGEYYLTDRKVRIIKKGNPIHNNLVKHSLAYLDGILVPNIKQLKELL